MTLISRPNERDNRSGEAGSALVYILVAIALLAALTVAFMNSSPTQTANQNAFRAVSEVQTQVDFIRAALEECVLINPGGDDGLQADGSPRTDAADLTNIPYPIMPAKPYLDNCVGNPAVTSPPTPLPLDRVSLLRCPGNPGDDPCHAEMFGGNTGKYLPPAPALFREWRYYNGADGVFFWIETTATDAYMETVMDKLDAQYATCEADWIDGGNTNLTSTPGELVCAAGSKCLRIWLKASPSAVNTDCP